MKHDVIELDDPRRDWARSLLTERWGAPQVVTRGVVYRADELPGFVALLDGRPVGLVTFRIDEAVAGAAQAEIVSLDAVEQGRGVGTALVDAVKARAASRGCTRLWLITTNDNLAALRFWQRRGFSLVAVHRAAIARSRRLKPSIPAVGLHGILIRDEIELEQILQ